MLTHAAATPPTTIPTAHIHATPHRLTHSIPFTPVNSVLTKMGPSARPTHMANCTSPLLQPSNDCDGACRLMRGMLRLCGMAPILEMAKMVRRPLQTSADDAVLELVGRWPRALGHGVCERMLYSSRRGTRLEERGTSGARVYHARCP